MRQNILWKMMVLIIIVLFPSLILAYKAPSDAQKDKILRQAHGVQVPFMENMGQVKSEDVRFYAKTLGGTIFVEKNGLLTYSLPAKDKNGVIIKEILTERSIKVEGLRPSATRVSYFKGKDKSKWKANIPTYESVSLGEICKGVDLTLKAYGNNVEKLFNVLPKENPELIKIKITGAKGLRVNAEGQLEVITEFGPVRFIKPLAYQKIGGEKKPVPVAYVIYKGNIYGFKVGDYDKTKSLIIDPLLASTFIGGDSSDWGYSMAIDGNGNIYVTGRTFSSDYPTTSGAYDEIYDGDDVFVSKLDSSLGSLLASTYLGGGSNETGQSIAIDGSGNVYVTGHTNGSDYPTTSGAYDEGYNGGIDRFISKLDSSLGSLLASTYLGGGSNEGVDICRSITIDGSGNIYVTGFTDSSDYPTTSGAYDQSHNGNDDVFLSKLDSSLGSLLASTFIGGGSSDWGYSIAIDGSGNIYVTGFTDSSDYPTTSGAYDQSHNGYSDVFLSKLDSSLGSLLASTFIGGGGGDPGRSITIDGSGNIYVTGYTYSSNYPTTSGAYDESHNGNIDVFLSKLDSSLGSLLASTFIGGGSNDLGYSIAIDGSGDIYVTGYTYSYDYPTTSGAYDESYNGDVDVFVSKLDSSLGSLLASTYLGGGHSDSDYADETGASIAIDGSGNIYVAGYTYSYDYPTTSGAYDQSHNGPSDVFVSKLDSDLSSSAVEPSIAITNVYTAGDDGSLKTTFYPDEPIQFHIIYDVQGDSGTEYKVRAKIRIFGNHYPPLPETDFRYPGTYYHMVKDRYQGKRIKVPTTVQIGKVKTVNYKLKLKLDGDVLDIDTATSQITIVEP